MNLLIEKFGVGGGGGALVLKIHVLVLIILCSGGGGGGGFPSHATVNETLLRLIYIYFFF